MKDKFTIVSWAIIIFLLILAFGLMITYPGETYQDSLKRANRTPIAIVDKKNNEKENFDTIVELYLLKNSASIQTLNPLLSDSLKNIPLFSLPISIP